MKHTSVAVVLLACVTMFAVTFEVDALAADAARTCSSTAHCVPLSYPEWVWREHLARSRASAVAKLGASSRPSDLNSTGIEIGVRAFKATNCSGEYVDLVLQAGQCAECNDCPFKCVSGKTGILSPTKVGFACCQGVGCSGSCVVYEAMTTGCAMPPFLNGSMKVELL